jgi:HTH-like domain
MEHQLPVAVVCAGCWTRRAPRSMPAVPAPTRWCGQARATSISDPDLLELIRQVLAVSPFAGEGYPKVRARLRREHGVRVSGKRVLRLLRREGLLAPQRVRGRRRPRPHDGTIIPAARSWPLGATASVWTGLPPGRVAAQRVPMRVLTKPAWVSPSRWMALAATAAAARCEDRCLGAASAWVTSPWAIAFVAGIGLLAVGAGQRVAG